MMQSRREEWEEWGEANGKNKAERSDNRERRLRTGEMMRKRRETNGGVLCVAARHSLGLSESD